MNLTEKIKNLKGMLIVEVEGFFTERFLNVCRVNNILIYDIINITDTVVRFKINISEFKKIRKVAKKTKCRVKIIKKSGIYFFMFKYRKRSFLFFLILILILLFMLSTCFIWKINIENSNLVDKSEITDILKNNGIYKGRLKLGLDKNYILKNIRADLKDISWVGLEINGTTANLKLIDKVILNSNEIQDKTVGNIISKKNGILTKLIVENGVPLLKIGSYINVGDNIIDGDTTHAKGIVKANVEYVFDKKYTYNNITKEYNNKRSYSLKIDKKEIGYLNKDKKYLDYQFH
ncbi:MAG: sporulation protein YqfD [Clostridia bacterium]